MYNIIFLLINYRNVYIYYIFYIIIGSIQFYIIIIFFRKKKRYFYDFIKDYPQILNNQNNNNANNNINIEQLVEENKKLKNDVEQKDKEIYDLKHDLISNQVRIETLEEELSSLESDKKELLSLKARLVASLEDALLGPDSDD